MRSKRCAVQNQGITLKGYNFVQNLIPEIFLSIFYPLGGDLHRLRRYKPFNTGLQLSLSSLPLLYKLTKITEATRKFRLSFLVILRFLILHQAFIQAVKGIRKPQRATYSNHLSDDFVWDSFYEIFRHRSKLPSLDQ